MNNPTWRTQLAVARKQVKEEEAISRLQHIANQINGAIDVKRKVKAEKIAAEKARRLWLQGKREAIAKAKAREDAKKCIPVASGKPEEFRALFSRKDIREVKQAMVIAAYEAQ